MNDIKHTPIMVQEIIDNLPTTCESYLDGTAGHGGHIAAIAASGKLSDAATIFAVDRDSVMLEKAKRYLEGSEAESKGHNISYIQDSYANISSIIKDSSTLSSSSKGHIDFILLDIGVNMEHFKDGSRGFSIHDDAPLDMRFDMSSGLTAAEILNTYSTEQLTHMFITYGDFSPKSSEYFTNHIIETRQKKPYLTTKDLIDSLYSIGVRKNQLPIIFQCLRIETNQELAQLETFLKEFPSTLSVGGRCAIITFHSTEDRIVKYAFKALDESGDFKLVNKKVIPPHYTEVQKNRAARSAKLRVIEKVNSE